MDKETIIKGCENWVNNHKGEDLLLAYSSIVELLALLKEQDNCENCAIATEDRQPVVRCKDCKHWYFADNRIPSERENVCGRNGTVVTPDWFCADGERQEGR